jgi:hypothetical protein
MAQFQTDSAIGARDVLGCEVGVFRGASLIPDLSCYGAASKINGSIIRVLKLEKDAVVRTTLELDVVDPRLNHGTNLLSQCIGTKRGR